MADVGLSTRGILQTSTSESRNQWVYPLYTKIGPPMNGDWTPGRQGFDPRCAETGPPRDKATGPSIPLTRTQGFAGVRASRDSGLRGIRDFVGFKTSQDLGLHGIQDSVGPRTSWDSRLCGTQDFVGSRILQKTGTLYASDQDLVLWCSLREHKLTWTPLGIRLVDSVINCVLFYGS